MEAETLELRLEEIVRNKEFAEKLLSLKTKDEVKKLFSDNGIEINDVEIEQLGANLRMLVPKLISGELTDKQLENLSSGEDLEKKKSGIVEPNSFTRFVGKVLSTPVMVASYTAGAIVGGLPKGFYDGWQDTWYGYNR